MGTDSGVQADAVDDGFGVQTPHLRIGVQLVEEGNPHGKIGVCEKLYRFRLCGVHEQRRDLLLDGPLLQQSGENFGILLPLLGHSAHDDPGRVEVIV